MKNHGKDRQGNVYARDVANFLLHLDNYIRKACPVKEEDLMHAIRMRYGRFTRIAKWHIDYLEKHGHIKRRDGCIYRD